MDAANDVSELVPHAGDLDLRDRTDSLVGRIASEIAREIAEGHLPPGADLNSVELASRFGTSRTPVREALMLLEKEGVVEIPPRRRPRVSRISLEEVEELYQIRAVLNAMMMRLFVRNATHEQLEEMVALHDEVKRAAARSPDEFQEARRRLHNFWLHECGNASLRNLLSTWKMRMSVSRLVSYSDEDIERSLKDHDRIITACLDRDEPLVMALMQSMTLAGLDAIKRQRRAKG